MFDTHTLADFTLTEFRAFKRAFCVLLAAGIHPSTAHDILVQARNNKRQEHHNARVAERASYTR